MVDIGNMTPNYHKHHHDMNICTFLTSSLECLKQTTQGTLAQRLEAFSQGNQFHDFFLNLLLWANINDLTDKLCTTKPLDQLTLLPIG